MLKCTAQMPNCCKPHRKAKIIDLQENNMSKLV